ncbi:MAG: biopolymer transporter ExbD [Lentisphaeria bacterium]|nr:biopolymer transporter ExbD [Lentisphaeria bacterium]
MLRLSSNLKVKSIVMETAPIVDVVLLLLLFFILNSSMILQPGVKIDLPETIEYTMLPTNKMIVMIPSTKDKETGKQLLFFNNKVIKLDDFDRLFREALRENKKVNYSYSSGDESMNTVLVIKADVSTPIGLISKIRGLARSQGIGTIDLMERSKK